MRKRTMIFGVPVLLLAFGFMFASCDSSVEVRDRAAEWVPGGGGRGPHAPDAAGVSITITGVPADLRYGATVTSIQMFRVYGTGAPESISPTPPQPGRRPFPVDAQEVPHVALPADATAAAGTIPNPTNLIGAPRGLSFDADNDYNADNNIEQIGSFTLRAPVATVGNHIIRFRISGEHLRHYTSITDRVFEWRGNLEASNSISLGSFTQVHAGTTDIYPPGGPARIREQDLDAPPTHPGVTLPLHPVLEPIPSNLIGTWVEYTSDDTWVINPDGTLENIQDGVTTTMPFTISGNTMTIHHPTEGAMNVTFIVSGDTLSTTVVWHGETISETWTRQL